MIDHINRKFKNVKMIFVTADTGSLASFREAGHAIKRMRIPIDGFIGFPDVMAVPWEQTNDGYESHFQKNYLCSFLLVNIILDWMAPGSRIVLVTSSMRTEAPAPTWVDVGFSVSGICVILENMSDLSRMERTITVLMDTHSLCWQSSCLSSPYRGCVRIDQLPRSQRIREVSLTVYPLAE